MLRRLLRLLRSASSRAGFHRIGLEPLIQFVSDDPAGDDLPEWLPTVLRGECRSAMALPTGGEAVCRVRVRGSGRLTVLAGLEGDATVRVRCELRATEGTESVHEGFLLDRGSGWVPLTLRLPSSHLDLPVTITFRCEAEAGSRESSRGWWADPVVEWRSPPGELARAAGRGLRQHGLLGLWTRLRAHDAAVAAEQGAAYLVWLAAQQPDAAALQRMRAAAERPDGQTRFAVLLVAGPDVDAIRRTLTSVQNQIYPLAELWICTAPQTGPLDPLTAVGRGSSWAGGPLELGEPDRTSGLLIRSVAGATTADALNIASAAAAADFVTIAEAGDELAPDALLALAAGLADQRPDPDILYSDEDCQSFAGLRSPTFKPGWSPEFLLSRMYMGRMFVIRRRLLLAIGGFRSAVAGAMEYDVALRATAVTDRVRHLPRVLYHRAEAASPASARAAGHSTESTHAAGECRALEDFARASGRSATVLATGVPGVWRVRHAVQRAAPVTIVIPSAGRSRSPAPGRPSVLGQCLRSIVDSTSYPSYDVLVADDGVLPEDAAMVLAGLPHRRVSRVWNGAFNFSRKLNFAVAQSSAEYILLLNDDVEIINRGWLTAMMEYAQQEAIGAVGAKLFYPDGRLQHVGVAVGVGVGRVAAHLLHQQPGQSSRCENIAVSVRNCSAVTAACLLTRRTVYDQVGGFDERLPVDFNDVDFCLKLRRAGYRIVFTPYARLHHHESASFGDRVQDAREIQRMRERWGATLAHDPYYNPNLSRDFSDCRLSPVRRNHEPDRPHA